MAVNLSKTPVVHKPGAGGVGLSMFTIYAALQLYKNAATFPMSAAAFDQLAWSIADGVSDWIDNPLNVTLAGISTGTVGVGAIPEHGTKLVVLPIIPLMSSGLASAGLVGPLASSLSIVVTLAIAHAVTQFGGYTGVCPTVGVGTDVSKVVMANPGALIVELQKAMATHRMTGAASARMATGLGLGIASLVLTGVGNGKVVGPPGPSPSTGPSFSKVG